MPNLDTSVSITFFYSLVMFLILMNHQFPPSLNFKSRRYFNMHGAKQITIWGIRLNVFWTHISEEGLLLLPRRHGGQI